MVVLAGVRMAIVVVVWLWCDGGVGNGESGGAVVMVEALNIVFCGAGTYEW